MYQNNHLIALVLDNEEMIKEDEVTDLRRCLPFLGHHGGAHPQPDERHPHDLQHFPVLQHLRAHDLSFRQGHQPDDHHMQSVHHPGCLENLGASEVRGGR